MVETQTPKAARREALPPDVSSLHHFLERGPVPPLRQHGWEWSARFCGQNVLVSCYNERRDVIPSEGGKTPCKRQYCQNG